MFSPHSHSGFHQATVSKCLLATVVVSTILLSLPLNAYRSYFINASKASPAYTYFTSKLVFLDTKDLIPGALLLYYFRIFERRYGQRKFCAFLLFSFACGLALEALVFNLLQVFVGGLAPPCGPVALVFSLFVPFFVEVPRVEFAHILGVPVTGKSFVYLLGLQLGSSGWGAALLAACGLATGVAWQRWSGAIFRCLAPPKPLCRLAANWLDPLLRSSPPVNRHTGATLELQRQEQLEQWEQQMRSRWMTSGTSGGGAAGEAPETPDPTEEHISRLTDMGFSRQSVVQALRLSNNNLPMAMNVLLQEA